MTVDSNFRQVLQGERERNTRKRVLLSRLMKFPFIFYDMKIMIAFNRVRGGRKLIYLSDSDLESGGGKKGLNASCRARGEEFTFRQVCIS